MTKCKNSMVLNRLQSNHSSVSDYRPELTHTYIYTPESTRTSSITHVFIEILHIQEGQKTRQYRENHTLHTQTQGLQWDKPAHNRHTPRTDTEGHWEQFTSHLQVGNLTYEVILGT